MSATDADASDVRNAASRLGFQPGQIVVEIGYDDDTDVELRAAVEETIGSPLLDEDYDDVADTVLLWWRDDDGDLVDALVDALGLLTAGGAVWLLTPKAGRAGHVEPSDIEEAAPSAGLAATKSTSAAPQWAGTRLVAPRLGRR